MNTALLVVALILSALFFILLAFSFVYARWLQNNRHDGPVDLTNENGEIDPVKQIKHLKKSTAEFGIKYDELKFGKMLGKGSQGEVFKATWRGSTVAVKKVDTRKVPPEIIEEFAQEAQIMRRLRHPTLTLFMGVSLEHPHLCIVTELVARGSLFDIIHDEHAALTWTKCLQIAVDVARGLTYLHAHSPPILHRDLKSLNILVDENWHGKVADFGMTRFQEEGTMTQCGSPLWMSPEMIRNDPYDEKADVYSFAVVLWEMYTRKIPYRDLGLNPSHLVVKVVKEHLRPPIPKQCPKQFKNLIEKCWAPQAEKRPTFPQILKVLEGFMQDPTIINHKPMSSRESTIVVRPERIETDGDVLGAIGNALGLASGEFAWKIDTKDVAFYNESNASFQEIAEVASLDGSNSATPGPPKGGRGRSLQNINSGSDKEKDKDGAKVVKETRPSPTPSSTGATTPTEPVSNSADPTPGGDGKKKLTKRTSSRKDKADPASVSSLNNDVPASPSVDSVQAAPLVLNTNIKSTKEAKTEEDSAASGASLASQGPGVMLGKFRNKIVSIKTCYLSRVHLVLSNEERVLADLDGGMKDSKVAQFIKRLSGLRHPNIVLFQGAYLESVQDLKSKLKHSGQLSGSALDDSDESRDVTNLSLASSSSSSSYGSAMSLTRPPPDCEYYLGMVNEFMPRGTLQDILLNQSLVLDWDTMVQLLIDAAAGLAYLHGNQPNPVIHQALTSERLLVDKNWRVKVGDFGFVDLQASLSGTPLPATPWSAPEYIKNPTLANVTMAGNTYSFGLLMWQALVRKPLFDGKALTKELQDKIVKQGDRPQWPSSFTSKDFKNLVEKCFMADPHARPNFTFILEELQRLKKLGPPKFELKLGVNAHKYRKAKTVFAYRSKDCVTIMKDWGTNIGRKNCIIIFSGEDDVYLCDEDVFNSTYEKLEDGVSDNNLGAEPAPQFKSSATGGSAAGGADESKEQNTPGSLSAAPSRPGTASDAMRNSDKHEYRKTGTVLARMMEEAFSVKTNGGTEHGMAGDYLVQNDAGDQWSIEAKTFLDLYERWD